MSRDGRSTPFQSCLSGRHESGARSRGTNDLVYLAGLRIPDEDVRELAKLVDEPTRSFLEKALAMETANVALTIADRERILWALDDVRTDALAELRGVLVQELEWASASDSSRSLGLASLRRVGRGTNASRVEERRDIPRSASAVARIAASDAHGLD